MNITSFRSQTIGVDPLVSGHTSLLLHDTVPIQAGQRLQRGSVLGVVTPSGKYVLSQAGSIDGSEVPRAVLIDEADASAGEVTALACVRGELNEKLLVFGAGHSAATVRATLRDAGILLTTTFG